MAADGPPDGWILSNGVVTPGDRVVDFAARLQKVAGVCRAKGYSRRVELDARALCDAGLGRLAMSAIQRTWRCQRLDGCNLDFHAAPPDLPLRLAPFVGRPNVRLRLRCREGRCAFHRVWRVEEMIAGLERRRQGGPATEVAALGALMTAPCPVCGKTAWAAEVLWVDTASMGWKVKGELSFDGAEGR